MDVKVDTEISDRGIARRVKQHLISKEHVFFAVFQPGFETTVVNELKQTGICAITQVMAGGVEYSCRLEECYSVSICSRVINRILMRIMRFRVDRFDRLRTRIERHPWELFIRNGMGVSFHITSKRSKLYHTGRLEEEIRAGLLSRLEKYRSSISFPAKSNAGNSQKIFVRLESNTCQVSLDMTGELMYKRGQKTHITDAPLRETTAAAILMESRLNDYDILIDPMCGSGTFSLEAAGIFNKVPPHIDRDFIFKTWPCFRPKTYGYLTKKLLGNAGDNTCKSIYTSDLDSDAVTVTGKNFETAGYNPQSGGGGCKLKYSTGKCQIEVSRRNFSRPVELPAGKNALIVLNPPYGKRIKPIDMKPLYSKIGNIIRKHYNQCGWAIISPGLRYEKQMALSHDKKIVFRNAGIKVAVIIRYCPEIGAATKQLQT